LTDLFTNIWHVFNIGFDRILWFNLVNVSYHVIARNKVIVAKDGQTRMLELQSTEIASLVVNKQKDYMPNLFRHPKGQAVDHAAFYLAYMASETNSG